MKLTKTTALLTFATACTVVSIATYAYFFVSMKSKTEETISLTAQSGQFSVQHARYTAVVNSLQLSKSDIEKLSSYYIRESGIVLFTKKLEALGTQAGVKLSIESLDPGLVPGGGAALGFRLDAEGKFENTQKFLILLQNFPGKFEWRSLQLKRAADASDSSTAKATSAPLWRVEVSLVALNFLKE